MGDTMEGLTPEMVKMRKKRRRVAQELLETEALYVQNLDLLKSSFYDPLFENSKNPGRVITTDDVRTIFGSLNIILPVNKLLLGELEKRLQVPESEFLVIGDAFETLAYCLKSYTAYCNDFENTRHILARLKKNSAFASFFTKISANEALHGKTIFDLMILPVQRIPRYRMLLAELYKNTWEEHPDYKSLGEACRNVNETAQSVEDSQEKYANINKIIAIQQDLKIPRKIEKEIGTLLQADRKFSLEGVVLCSENESQDTHSRKILLFNDILLVTKVTLEKSKDAKKKKESLKVKKIVHLNQVTNIMKSSSVEQQPSLSIHISNQQLNLHIDNQKLIETWYKTLVDCRTYALQKKEMNDRSSKNTSASDSKRDRWTLKRKKTVQTTSFATPTKETVVDNPLFGQKVPNRRQSQLMDEDYVRKSPSMNAMVDPTKKAKAYKMNTTESESGSEVRASTQKRKLFARSTSVDALHKIAQTARKASKELSSLNTTDEDD